MKSLFRPFPLPLSGRQKFYLFVLQGLGAGIIDAGANFGIAYAMYSKQDQVKMWIFDQNTIAGDLGVTPIVQTLASMIISSTLVHTDLHNSKIRPLAFCYPHVEHLPDPRTLFGKSREVEVKERGDDATIVASRSTSGSGAGSITDEKRPRRSPSAPSRKGLSYYYWMLVRFIFEGTEQNMLAARPGVGAWFGRLAWTAAQGAALGIVFGFPIWCLFIVILGPIYGTRNMGGTWAPQIIKGVYGAVVGWVTNPVIAVLALGSQAEQSLLVVEADEEAATEGQEQGHANPEGLEELDEGVQTIPEDEVLSPPPAINSGPAPIRRHSAASRPPSPSTPFRWQGHSTPNRSRAGSASSSLRSVHTRPPLTANTSYLSPLPSPSAPTAFSSSSVTGRLRARSAAQSPSTIVLAPPVSPFASMGSYDGRQRGATVSYPSAAESAATGTVSPAQPSTPLRPPTTPRSFSYALGGSGGRAQRTRSRATSAADQLPPPTPMYLPPAGRAGDQ